MCVRGAYTGAATERSHRPEATNTDRSRLDNRTAACNGSAAKAAPSIASFVAFWQLLRDGASRCTTDATHQTRRRLRRYERLAVANAQPRRTSSRSHPPTIPISPPDSKHKSAMSAMLQDPQRSRSSPADSRVRKPIPTILHDGSILLDRPILLERYSIAHLHT